MPKRKQQQQQQDAAGGRSGGSKSMKSNKPDVEPVTLPNLFTLPEEIRRIILSHACSKEGGSSKWKVDPDLTMVRSLILVSKQFHDYFNPLLYAHVRIDTPSALRQFHASLHSRAANAALVKSFHLGPLKTLHETFWPVRMKEEDEEPFQADEPMVIFKTGLSTKDEKLRPRGLKADKEFRYEEGNSRADKVLRQAFEELDVEPYDECYFEDTSGNFIGIVEWTKRILWIQGILDLYLIKMRELDDAKAASEAKKVTYPRLVLEGFVSERDEEQSKSASGAHEKTSAKTKGKKANTYVVTPEKVEEYWQRAGAYSDHFDHPLYFAQPDLRFLARNVYEQVIVNPAGIRSESYLRTSTEKAQPASTRGDDDQEGSPSASHEAEEEHQASDSEIASGSPAQSGPPITTTPISPSGRMTRDGLLGLAKSVLELTLNASNLSLTGIFQDGIMSSKLPILEQLRYLSIGPLTSPEDAALCLEEETTLLPALGKLRVCGSYPGIGVACLIGGECAGLPSLQEVHWDCGDTKVDRIGGATFLWKMLNIMRGAKETEEPNLFREQHPPPCRYIEFRVHSKYVKALLDIASTPEIKTALADGQPASDAQRALRIMKSRAETEGPRVWSSPPQQLDVLRREGQEWWKERALELERS